MTSNQRQRITRNRNDAVIRMTRTLEACASATRDDDAALLLGMAAKALAQLKSHNDRVTAEAMDFKDGYERMGRLVRELVGELEEEVDVLAAENGRLRAELPREREEAHLSTDGSVMNEIDRLERERVPAEALSESSPARGTALANTRRRQSFSGDVYNQLDEFEQSLDMELEEFQRLEYLSDELELSLDRELEDVQRLNDAGTLHTRDNEDACSSCSEFHGRETPIQHNISPKTSEGSSIAPTGGHPFHLLPRVFQTQDDAAVPALTTSDSLFSLSSDCSIRRSSSSHDILGFAPAEKVTRMSPGPNAEWGIVE